jgi:hypothetical protein
LKTEKDAWLREFFPEYTEKGKKLYHRSSTLTPVQRLTKDFFERVREEGIVTADTGETVMGLRDGFVISFLERDGKWIGMAYTERLGKEIRIVTPATPTRQDADRFLDKIINAYKRQ